VYTLLGWAPVDYINVTEFKAWETTFGESDSPAALAIAVGRF